MIKAIIAILTKIPTPNPVLKIPSITEQLVTEKEANSINSANVNLFFIMYYLGLLYKFRKS